MCRFSSWKTGPFHSDLWITSRCGLPKEAPGAGFSGSGTLKDRAVLEGPREASFAP